MADLDPNQDSDPAADFLAQEQDQLKDFEGEDFGFNDAEQPPPDDFGFSVDEHPDAGDHDFDPFAEHATTDFITEAAEEAPEHVPGLDDLDERLEERQEREEEADPYASVRQADTHQAEPEKIRKWREEQRARLEKKDAEEVKKMLEWREQAAKELEDWHKHRSEQLGKTKAGNREGEAEFVRERDETVPGHEWERVCRLCEFNPKSSRNTRDVSRMRGILLQLKQNPIHKA